MTRVLASLASLASLAVLAVLAALACATPPPPPPPPPPKASVVHGLVRDTGSPDVLAWVSSPWSFSTTSYAIVAPEGLILVDTQFLPKETIAFVDDVERATGKKAVAAVVLHANPDKFNGTATLQARGVRVLTSSQVSALIPAVHEKRVRAFAARYAPDYPTAQALPEVVDVVAEGTQLALAGSNVTLYAAGPGCSAAHVILRHGDDVFAGDLVANGAHAWLEIGETLEWRQRLAEIRALSPKRVHPGRGLWGGPALLDLQERYLADVIAAVSAGDPRGPASDDDVAAAKARVIAAYPMLRFAVFLDIGLPAEWQRQAVLNTTKASEVSP